MYHLLYPQYLPSYNRMCHSDSRSDSISKGNEYMLFILSAPGKFLSKELLWETLWHTMMKKCWKNSRWYILSHSHRGITKVQITATATQAILWLSMQPLLQCQSLVESRSKTFLYTSAVALLLPSFRGFQTLINSFWEVLLAWLCLEYVAEGADVVEPSLAVLLWSSSQSL